MNLIPTRPARSEVGRAERAAGRSHRFERRPSRSPAPDTASAPPPWWRWNLVGALVASIALHAPSTKLLFAAYKAQQRRWTQGWVQLQRLHLRTLLTGYRTPPLRKLHLLYHMCISWQWALWAAWLTVLPFLIVTGLWFGALGTTVGVLAYLTPSTLWLLTATVIASVETRHSYRTPLTWRVLLSRLARVVPYTVINTGMLPHQFSAFSEGAFGPLHSEFERTPKAATITASSDTSSSPAPAPASQPAAPRRAVVKVHRPYVAAEAFFIVYQLCWALLYASRDLWQCAIGALFLASCVAGLAWFYGDQVGQRLFLLRAPTGGRRG